MNSELISLLKLLLFKFILVVVVSHLVGACFASIYIIMRNFVPSWKKFCSQLKYFVPSWQNFDKSNLIEYDKSIDFPVIIFSSLLNWIFKVFLQWKMILNFWHHLQFRNWFWQIHTSKMTPVRKSWFFQLNFRIKIDLAIFDSNDGMSKTRINFNSAIQNS